MKKEEFDANLNELKRQAPDQFGHMLPYCKLLIIKKTSEFIWIILIETEYCIFDENKFSLKNEQCIEQNSINCLTI